METPGDGHGERASISSHPIASTTNQPSLFTTVRIMKETIPFLDRYAAKRLVDDKVKLHSYAEIIADIAEKVVGHDLELKESVK